MIRKSGILDCFWFSERILHGKTKNVSYTGALAQDRDRLFEIHISRGYNMKEVTEEGRKGV